MASTLYDDLGVSSRATREEIRDAHRRMAKLLHPDHCQDETTRKLAEAHMKRVNAAAAVLADDDRRRQYDLQLKHVHAAPRPPLRVPAWTWAAAACFALLAGWGLQRPERPPAPDKPTAPGESRPSLPTPPRSLAKSRTPPERPRPEPKPKAAPQAKQPQASPPLRPRDFVAPPPSTIQAPPSFDAPPSVSVEAALPAPPRETLAGNWMYLKPAVAKQGRNSYPPEFIEMVIVEEGNAVKGRYQARYRVSDMAISPDVRFTFEGNTWKGNGGSSGEIELKLLSPDSLRVSWVTTEAGPDLSLGSGAAILIRRRLP